MMIALTITASFEEFLCFMCCRNTALMCRDSTGHFPIEDRNEWLARHRESLRAGGMGREHVFQIFCVI
jgi:hypothetical protein